MTQLLASDFALTAEIVDMATGLEGNLNFVRQDDVIDLEYTIVSEIDAAMAVQIDAPLMIESACQVAGDMAPAVAAKKIYETPYVTRGQFFKKLREEGKLQPRTTGKLRSASKTVVPAENKPARERSAKELSAIRRRIMMARNAA